MFLLQFYHPTEVIAFQQQLKKKKFINWDQRNKPDSPEGDGTEIRG